MSILPQSDSVMIREVWADNLLEEFALIREIVGDYPYIAIDTELPGIVVKPAGNFRTFSEELNYLTLKSNVDILNVIQLGLTFSDDDGNLPCYRGTGKYCVWQFNFREFNLAKDKYAVDSIELLQQSGIDFNKNNEKGIDAHVFGELLISSGIVLNPTVHWVTFHGASDLGYLLKLLTRQPLPPTPVAFFNLMNIYFPTMYDIKHMMNLCNDLRGGLSKVAELLDVKRIGVRHQAGSDSLLTSDVFTKLAYVYFNGLISKYAGVLYGYQSFY